MKFEKITDTKIRIILSFQDMESNNITAENVLSNTANSQKLLETMITKAEKELGFKPEDSKLLIEAVPSNGECIFTITKLSDEKAYCIQASPSFIFKFDNFDDFIHLCTYLSNFSYLCLNEISKDFSLIYYNCAYYLEFTDVEHCSIVLDYIKTFFSEFGKDVSGMIGIEGILNEYGKTIFAQNAISKCINSFTQKN